MSAVNLLSLRAALVTDIRAGMSPVAVNPHAGRFDLAELEKYGLAAPEIRVAIVSVPQLPELQATRPHVQCAAYIVCKGGKDSSKTSLADERGLVIASALIRLLNRTHLAASVNAKRQELVSWQNLYTGAIGEQGVHLSACTWRQQLELYEDTDATGLAALLRIVNDYSEVPPLTDTITPAQ